MRKPLLCLLFLLAAGGGQAADRPFQVDAPRSQAMGNTRIATTDSADSPFFNPACFAETGSAFTIARINLGMNGDGAQLYTGVGGNIKKYSEVRDLSRIPADLLEKLANFHARYRMTGPAFVAYKGEGYGFGLYSSLRGNVDFSGAILPVGSLNLDMDIGLVTGLGMQIPLEADHRHALLFGVSLKYVNRIRFQTSNVSFHNAGKILFPLDLHSDYLLGQAIGSDIGVIYKLDRLSVGLVWYDWFGTTFSWKKYNSHSIEVQEDVPDTRVAPRVSIGASYRLGTLFGISDEIVSDTILSLDIQDFFLEENSFFKMIHLGMESRILHTFFLRLGLNSGYLTCGLGIRLWGILTLDYTYFAEEGGTMPGQDFIPYHFFSATIRL